MSFLACKLLRQQMICIRKNWLYCSCLYPLLLSKVLILCTLSNWTHKCSFIFLVKRRATGGAHVEVTCWTIRFITAPHLNPLLCNLIFVVNSRKRTKVKEQKGSRHPALSLIVHQDDCIHMEVKIVIGWVILSLAFHRFWACKANRFAFIVPDWHQLLHYRVA